MLSNNSADCNFIRLRYQYWKHAIRIET